MINYVPRLRGFHVSAEDPHTLLALDAEGCLVDPLDLEVIGPDGRSGYIARVHERTVLIWWRSSAGILSGDYFMGYPWELPIEISLLQ